MIVLVKISARRYVAIDTPKHESAWTTISVRGWAERDDDGVIYGRGDLIAGPADLDTCYAAMAKRAAENKALVRIADWERLQKERADALREANAALQARQKAEGWS
jgi:hypothetical protein